MAGLDRQTRQVVSACNDKLPRCSTALAAESLHALNESVILASELLWSRLNDRLQQYTQERMTW